MVKGVVLSKRKAQAKERDIIEIIRLFPTHGTVTTNAIVHILKTHAPHDKYLARAIQRLQARNVELKQGLTHSDLGRVNIISGKDGLRIVDWGRAGERPFWLIDAVYLLVRLHGIQSADEWHERGAAFLMAYANIEREVAEALYDVYLATEILHKRYPKRYQAVVEVLQNMTR